MLKNLLVFSVFALIVLMIFPAYAAVESFSLERGFYTNEEDLVFVGVEKEGKKSVFIIIRDPSGEYIGMFSDPSSDVDGSFSTIPRTVETFFTSSGIYNATAFTDDQNENEGISIKLEYDGNRIAEFDDFVLTLKTISDKTITERNTLSFTAGVTDSSLDKLIFSLDKNPPSGASIDSETGEFTWTPSAAQGNPAGIQYNFDIVVVRGIQEDRESITITVTEPGTSTPKDEPKEEPKAEPKEQKELGIASFVDTSKDPQSYVDRYNNEPSYKKWFDDNYPQYDSIKQAVGLDKPEDASKDVELAPFVDPSKDPQSYVDRYNNEPSYKKWFDDNYPQYDSIQQAVGIKVPKGIAVFVDPKQDPQYYVDRYNDEPTYKKWFDENFPEYDSIYEAVGLDEPETMVPKMGECGQGTKLVDGVCTVIPAKGGGCLIATAAYGSEMAPQVQYLREIRDNKVMSTEAGASFMSGFNQFYYSFSPTIADYERENPMFKEAVKIGLTPMMSSLAILDHAESENEILAYGISLIILNIGMYVAAPAIIVFKTKKFIKI